MSRTPIHSGETQLTDQKIVLRDLLVPVHIGITEKERASAQRLCINMELTVRTQEDLPDEIESVLHYGQLVSQVRNTCSETKANLLERLAEEISTVAFTFDQVLICRVRVEKIDRYADIAGIGVELERRRSGI
jgi:dihydroneopterin aldolase